MGVTLNNVSTRIVFGCIVLKVCSACSGKNDNTNCWYTLWYIWFVLGLFIIVFAVLVILYIKHRTKERTRVRRLHRNQRSVQVSIVPQQPPSYTEPSHKPPTYEEAISQHIGQNVHVTYPGMVPSITDEYAYQPPPTSMRMVNTPNSPQQQPPSYLASTQSQEQGQATSMRMVNTPNSPQQQPPSYLASTQSQEPGQGRTQSRSSIVI